ncbi:hypothetical protein L2E82_39441 [Cichorium intybus]|uniref:Uncharacterized protein n=1 Tax=Cichorium intybus TaxID=13427 RepID=A0ACB9AML2_CICIN|nr:hypothetical protein L2E82_39441 [Cichorium intybus]
MQKTMSSSRFVLFLLLSLAPFSFSHQKDQIQETFHECLSNIQTPNTFFTPNDTNFTQILKSRAINLKFRTPSTPKPDAIFTPLNETHIQTAVICAKKLGIHLRTRSGGHDYEGLSYTSVMGRPFVVIDLSKMQDVNVDLADNSVWAETGATIGKVYYRVAEKNRLVQIMNTGFPELGLKKEDCFEMSWIESVMHIMEYPKIVPPSVLLERKPSFLNYFKAKSDFVREVIPESGLEGMWKIMLEDESPLMIWNPYGGIMSKIPESSIPFPHRNGVLFKVQYVSAWMDPAMEDKHVSEIRKLTEVSLRGTPSTPKPDAIFTPLNETHIQTAVICAKKLGIHLRTRSGGHDYEGLSYTSVMGRPFVVIDLSKMQDVNVDLADNSVWAETGATIDRLVQIMNTGFPELGLKKEDCFEMSWIESVMHIMEYPKIVPPSVLLERKPSFLNYFKAKSDFVREVIPESGLEGMWKIMLEDESPLMIWNPYGGIMSKIPESSIPFPHRNGVLFKVQYVSAWMDPAMEDKHVSEIRKVYDYMTTYVTKSPREAYVNYRDLDIGMNGKSDDSWGFKYFKDNFHTLRKIKTKFDYSNFFSHEQSIPLID